MKFKEKIFLFNRDGAKNYLEYVNHDKKTVTYKYVDIRNLSYRVIFNEKYNNNGDGWEAIDPSGGPMMSVGSIIKEINKKLLKFSIENNNVLLIFER